METRIEQTFATKRRARNTTRRTPLGDVMRLFPWKHVNHAWLDMSCFNVSINPAHVMQRSRYHVSMGTLSIFLNAASNLVSWPRCVRHHPYCVSMELLRMRFCIMLRQSKSSSTMETDIFPWLRLMVFPWKHYKTPSHEASCLDHCMSLSCDVQPWHKSASMETRISGWIRNPFWRCRAFGCFRGNKTGDRHMMCHAPITSSASHPPQSWLRHAGW